MLDLLLISKQNMAQYFAIVPRFRVKEDMVYVCVCVYSGHCVSCQPPTCAALLIRLLRFRGGGGGGFQKSFSCLVVSLSTAELNKGLPWQKESVT